jgi:hypothetical protein
MAIQLDETTRNAMLDAIESTNGTSCSLQILSGTVPAHCSTSDGGTVLATISLPSDWMAGASSGAKAKAGTWQDSSADDTGTAGHFRLYNSQVTLDETTCFLQGTVTATGGGGDMTVDNTSFAAGQTFTVNTFALTAPGA